MPAIWLTARKNDPLPDMRLERIEILNFKNIAEARLELCGGLNCFLGLNGMGKSNLLEAIHLLCLGRGMSSMPESELIRHGEQMLSLRGDFRNQEREAPDSEADITAHDIPVSAEPLPADKVTAGIVRGKGKSMKLNGKEYDRISSHIGRFPLVAATPSDTLIVSGPAEGRRRLMDIVISQADKSYLATLIRYNKALESRNKMLRAGLRDELLFESVETNMQEAANSLHHSRSLWCEEIAPMLSDHYEQIAGNGERASLSYRSVLNDASLTDALAASRQKDIMLGYTSQGIHRDDLTMQLGDYSMRRLGSQGQVKTFAIALKFAIFEYLRRKGGITPILLLDDIFDKLDAGRVERIMQIVSREKNFSQIFITDTNRTHLDHILSHIHGEATLFEVDRGHFTQKEIHHEKD